jgi:hypothetical protein
MFSTCIYHLASLLKFASSILIYKELGWESLTERRKRRKLQMFYNMQNDNAPMYLCDFHHQFLMPFHLGIVKLKLKLRLETQGDMN